LIDFGSGSAPKIEDGIDLDAAMTCAEPRDHVSK
jgi:hypothetical protein